MGKVKEVLSHFQKKKEGRNYYYNIIQSMVDTLFVVDAQGKIKTVNRALLNLLGYQEEELIGKNVDTLFAREENFFNGSNWKKLIKKGSLRNFEMTYLTRDEQEISLNFSGSIMKDPQGKVTGIVCVNKDLREIKKLIAKLEKTESTLKDELKEEKRKNEELEGQPQRIEELENAKTELELETALRTKELSKTLTQLKTLQDELEGDGKLKDVEKVSAGVAHQIRNPLTFIGMSVQHFLDKLKPEDPNKELLEPIIEKIDTIKRITQSLIQFARTYQLSLQPTKIDQILDRIVNLIKPRCISQNVRVAKEYGAELPEVSVDQGKIEEVIFNLIENALKAMKKGGVLRVQTIFNPGNTLTVRISDTGEGISKQNLKRIFEPFFSTTNGTGLGLFVAKRMVEIHKGKISVESHPGKGTTFSVSLPTENGQQPVNPAPPRGARVNPVRSKSPKATAAPQVATSNGVNREYYLKKKKKNG